MVASHRERRRSNDFKAAGLSKAAANGSLCSGERVFMTLGTNVLSLQRTFPACLGVGNCRKDGYRSQNPFPPRTDP